MIHDAPPHLQELFVAWGRTSCCNGGGERVRHSALCERLAAPQRPVPPLADEPVVVDDPPPHRRPEAREPRDEEVEPRRRRQAGSA